MSDGVAIDLRNGVSVRASGERAEEWRRVFGTDELPVIGPVPQRVRLPGIGAQLAYMLDLKAIAPEVRARVVAHIAARFGLDPAAIEADLDELGVPLPAEGLAVAARGPRWQPL